MARTGLRMMPTFPSSPLRFRTAGFPQYGSKAGISDGAFPEAPDQRVSWFASALRVARGQKDAHGQCRGLRLGTPPPFERLTSLCPRGPRSGPGCSVPIHRHLSAPSAPLAGTSRLPSSAGYTRRLRCALRPRRPTSGSVLSLIVPCRHVALVCPRAVRRVLAPSCCSLRDSSSSTLSLDSTLPNPPRSVSRGLTVSGLPGSPTCYDLPTCSPSFDGSDRTFRWVDFPLSFKPPGRGPASSQADEGFYFRAFNESVALPVVGYDYGGIWAPPPAGLSPAGTSVSIAAQREG
jgi:hypothetical protein